MKPLLRIWPFFVSLLVSGLILAGIITRTEPAIDGAPALIDSPVSVQAP